MQVIGKMADGSVLVQMTAAMAAAIEMLRGIPPASTPVSPDITPANEKAGKPAPARKPAAKTKPAPAGGQFKCKQCGKMFARAPGSQREVCTDECRIKFNREYARKKYHEYKAKKAKPAAPGNDDAAFAAKRLALIKAAVEKAG